MARVGVLRAAALAVGTLAGVLILAGGWCGWRAWYGSSREVVAADYDAVKAQLDYNPQSLYRFDPDMAYRLKEGFVGIRSGTKDAPHHTNTLGLLGRFELNTDKDTRRWLVLGDSVAYGDLVAYEQTFVALLQSTAPENLQLMNGACPGWSTHQQRIFYDKAMRAHDWQRVVLVFCPNDLINFEWVYDRDGLLKLSAEYESLGGAFGLGESQKAFRILALRNRLSADPPSAPLAKHNNGTIQAWLEDTWPRYLKEEWTPLIQSVGAERLVVVALPTARQVEAARLGADPAVANLPAEKLGAFCREHGVPFIDGYPWVTGAAGSAETLYVDNLHFTPAGHSTVAKHLREAWAPYGWNEPPR